MYVFLEPFFDYLIPANDFIVIRSIVQNLLTLGFLYFFIFFGMLVFYSCVRVTFTQNITITKCFTTLCF